MPEEESTAPFPTVTTLTLHVTRKVSKNYNSTEYSAGMTLEIDPYADATEAYIAEVCATGYERLRTIIRNEFNRTKGQNENGGTTEDA
jgi:hypothetical protein